MLLTVDLYLKETAISGQDHCRLDVIWIKGHSQHSSDTDLT